MKSGGQREEGTQQQRDIERERERKKKREREREREREMTQKKTERLREREANKCKICHHKNTNGGEKKQQALTCQTSGWCLNPTSLFRNFHGFVF